jgi:glycosyltransferase involved in cell wall biosynthesis
MRQILLVIDSLDIGGAERHLVDLATCLDERGYGVEVACSAAGPLADELGERSIPLHVLCAAKVKRRTDARFALALRRLVAARRPDLVHAHLYASANAAALATVGTGIPLVVTDQTEAPWRSWHARLASRWVYRRAARVIAVSEAIRECLGEGYGVPAEKIAVVRNSVTPPPDDGRRGAPRPGGPVVGTVARLQPEKGLCFLLDAVPAIAAEVPGVRFVLVGDGPLRGELREQARRLGVEERVEFLGNRADARRLLDGFDVLVLPSISEGTPLTIVESMLAGVPVVASGVGGIPEQLDDGRTGLLVPPGDAHALARAVTRTLTEPGLAGELASAARAWARVELGHERMVERIESVYREAAGGAATPPRKMPASISRRGPSSTSSRAAPSPASRATTAQASARSGGRSTEWASEETTQASRRVATMRSAASRASRP